MVMPGNTAKLVNFASWGKNTLFWVHHQRCLGLDVFFKCSYSCLNIFLMLFIWLSSNSFYFFLSHRTLHSSSILCSSSRSGNGHRKWAVGWGQTGLRRTISIPVSWEELLGKGSSWLVDSSGLLPSLWNLGESFHLTELLQNKEISLNDTEVFMWLSDPSWGAQLRAGALHCSSDMWDTRQSEKNMKCVFSCHSPHDGIIFFMLYFLFMSRITKTSKVLGWLALKPPESWRMGQECEWRAICLHLLIVSLQILLLRSDDSQ